jgi:3',5'-cyclic AMP phosphodiesterase CpdA
MRIITFLHISDLHICDVDPATNDGTYDALAPRLWANSSWFDGLLGHSFAALKRLEQFLNNMRRDEQARLIVTGDLTCTGSNAQFVRAREYLTARTALPGGGGSVGLQEAGWYSRGISGNHDQWPGHSWIFGGPTPHLKACFPYFPVLSELPLALPDGTMLRLRFLGIDTDRDVGPYSRDRFFARGLFTSQLGPAASAIGLPEPDQIRVLLLHHSPAHPQTSRSLRIEANSLSALKDFVVEQDIPILLSGHVHKYKLHRTTLHHDALGPLDVLEARCGTTTQRDSIPPQWTNIFGHRPNRPLLPNSLVVHRLFWEEDPFPSVVWEAQVYQRTRFGFRPLPPDPSDPNVERLTVWPRP